MARHPPATSATASNAKTTHTTATSPTTATRHNAKPTSMPVCRRMRAARAAMPASAMTAPGSPMTPRKHIQASQDAAAMNARTGGSAARASKNRQTRIVVREARRACQAEVPPLLSDVESYRATIIGETFWLFISNVIQILLMPLIMVGQNV